mgnify:CR=1 FL=1
MGINLWNDKFDSIPFNDVNGTRQARYYQEIAVNKVMQAIADKRERILLTLATGTGKTFISGASNDVITMNGSTKGGLAGSWVQFTAIADNAYYVTGQLLGTSTLVTPFADA